MQIAATALWKSSASSSSFLLPSASSSSYHHHHMNTSAAAASLLHSPFFLNLKSTTAIVINNNNNGRIGGGRRRRRRPTFGSLKITSASLSRAFSFAMSLRDLFHPFNDLSGGGGGGGLGFPSGGSDGEWFGKRRKGGKFKGLAAVLLFSSALVSVILGVGNRKREEWELGIRVLLPLVLGLKISFWRHWLGILIFSGLASYLLLRRGESSRSKQW